MLIMYLCTACDFIYCMLLMILLYFGYKLSLVVPTFHITKTLKLRYTYRLY